MVHHLTEGDAHLTEGDAFDRRDTFGWCDAFYGLYMLSIPLPKPNLFVDCT